MPIGPKKLARLAEILEKQERRERWDYWELLEKKKQEDYQDYLKALKEKSFSAVEQKSERGESSKDSSARQETLKKLEQKKQIFLREPLILARRLDLAFDIFSDLKKCLPFSDSEEEIHPDFTKLQQSVLDFLKNTLDTDDVHAIEFLMAKNQRTRLLFPHSESLPGKAPRLTLLPRPDDAISAAQYQWRRLSELKLASMPEHRNIVTVTEDERKEDIRSGVRRFTPEERIAHQLIMRQGLFLKSDPKNPLSYQKCDTSSMLSHGKVGFTAFVITPSSEIYIFNHHDKKDLVAHSSFNAGAALLCAGEMQIIEGELRVLTDHSGHYQPSTLNIYNFLFFLKEKGIPITDKTLVRLFYPINKPVEIPLVEEISSYQPISTFVYRATDIMRLSKEEILHQEPGFSSSGSQAQFSVSRSTSSSTPLPPSSEPPASGNEAEMDLDNIVTNPLLMSSAQIRAQTSNRNLVSFFTEKSSADDKRELEKESMEKNRMKYLRSS